MVHTANGRASGNSKELRRVADMMDVFNDSLSESVAAKTGKTVDEVKALWFDYEDHWITAKQALEFGLIDEIIDQDSENVPENAINMTYQEVMAWYDDKKAPKNSYMTLFLGVSMNSKFDYFILKN